MNSNSESRTEFHIDLHVHSDVSSDGRSSVEKLAKAAASRGLDAIVLTDHESCTISKPVLYGGVLVFPGCECSSDAGHILGLFPERPPDINALRADGLPSVEKVVDMLHACGAVTILAHPYIRKNARTDAPVDCIETANARVYFKNAEANEQAAALAEILRLPVTGGSDAHAAGEVGNAYTVFSAADCSPKALREALIEGQCRPILVKNTPRRFKGYSQFRQARRSRNPGRVLKGLLYVGYCIMLDIFKR
jgi:predicted metal-dependent phosphoesterase TrpH